jgi:GMP synthase (glutamine-hydrolysing)
MILIIDFGSQTCHLIGRRLRNLGIPIHIIDPENAVSSIKKQKPSGIIFSGGPSSVYEKGAPIISKKVFTFGIPILGICYGWQLIAYLLGGKVVSSNKEYGPSTLKIHTHHQINQDVPNSFTIWLSHGDTVKILPKDFSVFASTTDVHAAFVGNIKRKIFGVQFHPEVEHTQFGTQILKNFVQNICNISIKPKVLSVDHMIKNIQDTVEKALVVGAVSGGTDSTIASILCIKAIGKRFIPVYVQSDLMRSDAFEFVNKIFNKYHIQPKIIEATSIFLKNLKGISDPEKKRIIIGNIYYKLIKQEVKKIKNIQFFLQGTIYSDVIESKGTKKSDKIKSHHNVGGLPKDLGLKLLEPLRELYTDEVRNLGKLMKLPDEIIYKQPFPGPGHAIRIMGEVTKDRLEKQQKADKIILEELNKSGWLNKIFQSFSVMTGIKSTAVKGDARVFNEVVAVRILTSKDRMTADWAKIPYNILQNISTRIVNEVPDVSRVVYDITTKPPATMEWE